VVVVVGPSPCCQKSQAPDIVVAPGAGGGVAAGVVAFGAVGVASAVGVAVGAVVSDVQGGWPLAASALCFLGEGAEGAWPRADQAQSSASCP